MGGGETMIIAGVGFSSHCCPEELAQLVRQAEEAAHCRAEALATLARKASSACLSAAAAMLALPILPIAAECLRETEGRLTTLSSRSLEAVGVASTAEAVALAGAGRGSRLALARIASAHATCALAEGDPA
jgi:cobalt-precorrin 5A hydrolase